MSPYRRYSRLDPRRYVVHLRLLGRRGGALLIGGIVWILQSLMIIRHHEPVPGYWLISHGWQIQAVAWMACGLIACWYAFYRQGRDAPGWYLGLGPMTIWVVVVIADAACEAIGTYNWGGLADVLLAGVSNFGILGWIFIMAGWREQWILTLPVDVSDTEGDDAP